MKNHKSLNPDDLLQRGPGKIAMMVASEFYRAASGAQYRSDVIHCYDRARELMGVLETVNLPEDAVRELEPFYDRCRASDLLCDAHLDPRYVEEFSARLADVFQKTGEKLIRGATHA